MQLVSHTLMKNLLAFSLGDFVMKTPTPFCQWTEKGPPSWSNDWHLQQPSYSPGGNTPPGQGNGGKALIKCPPPLSTSWMDSIQNQYNFLRVHLMRHKVKNQYYHPLPPGFMNPEEKIIFTHGLVWKQISLVIHMSTSMVIGWLWSVKRSIWRRHPPGGINSGARGVP